MALTELQRRVCRLIAANRKAGGESYVAGGVALNELLQGKRISRDIDLFHDTEQALASTWDADRRLLAAEGFLVEVLRERPGFVEARVEDEKESVLLQWARDSAYRFFPLVEHAELGLTLHPFDLATNKVLALIGRLEARDWIDLIQCHNRLQPLGYLMWAASGKDPGFGPLGILEEASRSGHYAAAEIDALVFEGPPPDAALLSREWHAARAEAGEIIAALPLEASGQAVLNRRGDLCRDDPETLRKSLASGSVVFHRGTIRGALPRII
jgi:hypothetical protein